MRWAAAGVLLLISTAAFATLGIFRGTLVEPPAQQSRAGWIFVQSPRGVLRQVEVSKAHIIYSEDVPAAGRATSPSDDLVPGTEVMVTAEQDDGGEWRATEIEILRMGSGRASDSRPPSQIARNL